MRKTRDLVVESAVTEAQRAYRQTHFLARGDEPQTIARAADPSGVLTRLGLLVGIQYLTTKAGDPPNSIYNHAFENPPILCFNSPERLLVIAGGSYKVTWRGIVG